MRDERGVPQVHVGPQEGGARGASLAVRGGLRTLNALLQRLLLRAPVRALGWLGAGARGHLGVLRASVGARRCCGGYRVALPAEVAGVWEVGGLGPGIEAAEPEIVPPLAKGASELLQVGTDAAPVVSAERSLPDRLPCVGGEYPVVMQGRYEVNPLRAGVSLGGRHIGVTSDEVGHKSVPSASLCDAPVGEGQQGVVCNHLPSHLHPVVAVQLSAQRGGGVGGEHEEQRSCNVTQQGQGVIVCRPPFFCNAPR